MPEWWHFVKDVWSTTAYPARAGACAQFGWFAVGALCTGTGPTLFLGHLCQTQAPGVPGVPPRCSVTCFFRCTLDRGLAQTRHLVKSTQKPPPPPPPSSSSSSLSALSSSPSSSPFTMYLAPRFLRGSGSVRGNDLPREFHFARLWICMSLCQGILV